MSLTKFHSLQGSVTTYMQMDVSSMRTPGLCWEIPRRVCRYLPSYITATSGEWGVRECEGKVFDMNLCPHLPWIVRKEKGKISQHCCSIVWCALTAKDSCLECWLAVSGATEGSELDFERLCCICIVLASSLHQACLHMRVFPSKELQSSPHLEPSE